MDNKIEIERMNKLNKQYDSKVDTLKHIGMVRSYILFATNKLKHQGRLHDKSKLEEPEKRIFDEFTPKLKNTTYGSDEYKTYLNLMQKGLNNHYKENRHHPEHFKNGIKDMNLFDLIEMFLDWKAATKRHADGDIYKSIKINKDRFKYDDLLESILKNTADYLNNSFEIIEQSLDKADSDETKEIVYDWWFGRKVDYEKNKKAYQSIMTLVSMGFG